MKGASPVHDISTHCSLTSHKYTAVKKCWLRRIGAETHLYAGENAVFEAKKTATLKGGGSWINLDASGVAVGGARIMLGGGATGTARKAPAPQLPEVPPTADLFSEYFIVKANGKPLPNVHYTIIFEDNSTLSGITDKDGKTMTILDKEKKNISIVFDQGFPLEIA